MFTKIKRPGYISVVYPNTYQSKVKLVLATLQLNIHQSKVKRSPLFKLPK